KVLGGGDHGQRRDLPAGQQLGGDGQCPRGLARARRGDQQEITAGQAEVLPERRLLPPAQRQEKIRPNETRLATAVIVRRGRGGSHRDGRLPAGRSAAPRDARASRGAGPGPLASYSSRRPVPSTEVANSRPAGLPSLSWLSSSVWISPSARPSWT